MRGTKHQHDTNTTGDMTETGTDSKHQNGAALLAEMDKTMPQKVAVCAAHLLLPEGSIVLDAGCANGMATAYFALKNPHVRVIGLDYDQDYIAAARATYGDIPNLEFVIGDLTKLDLGGRKLDAVLNLSILHEPYSYTGYRKQTVEDIIAAEIKNLKTGGIIINRDFVMPDNPEEMVYIALPDTPFAAGKAEVGGSPYDSLSMAAFFLEYAREAMRFDGGDPDGHIKGFFTEEVTDQFEAAEDQIPKGWRVFSVQHHFAWEFIWRMHYRTRFLNEAEEKYSFWTMKDHQAVPEKLGARVVYAAHHENPWLLDNRYAPNAMLFDRNKAPLPLPPSNFISVLQKLAPSESITLREHRAADKPPSYLRLKSFENTHNGYIYDMVERPGGDVVDVLPYFFDTDGTLHVYAKDQYPRPIANIRPRKMSPNLDRKTWSGHMIEPLAAANIGANIGADGMQKMKKAVHAVLTERAHFSLAAALRPDQLHITQYYPAPAELNERVYAVRADVTGIERGADHLSGGYSGFSNDGHYKAFSAANLLQAAQAGMLPEARLETNIYALMRETGQTPSEWLGHHVDPAARGDITPVSLDSALAGQKLYKVFEETAKRSHWLDIKRSEFHEVALHDGHERVLARKELEFIVPASNNVTTNSVMALPVIKDPASGEILIGVKKITPIQSQFAAVQGREDHSGLLSLACYRLPHTVDHIQKVPDWLAEQTGSPKSAIKKLGEGYFPSLGVMPHRIFPFVVTDPGKALVERCDFIPLREMYQNLHRIEDLSLLNAVFRVTHALNLWPQYSKTKPPRP